MELQHIIQFIVWYATQLDIPLSKNRLVKYMYLLDIFNARRSRGETLTKLPWAFVYFGPYCREATDAIDEAVKAGLINQQSFESHFGEDKDFYLFTCSDPSGERHGEQLDIVVTSKLKSAMKYFGEDTPALLDYVYFETEPMEAVSKKGENLDFALCQPRTVTKTIPLPPIPKKKKAHLRELISGLADNVRQRSENLFQDEKNTEKLKDELYFQALDAMNTGDLPVGLRGKAKIGE